MGENLITLNSVHCYAPKKGVGRRNWVLCSPLSTLFPLGTPLLGVQATELGTLHSFPHAK
uniref:Uncharacterized protein n=1 Tax=Desertifilum tharense IPPAS B-1220 TaxID=1781255 RepID=A0ACD5GT59_9CYAN